MTIPVQLRNIGTTLGVAAALGTAVGFGTKAVLESADGTLHKVADTTAFVGGVAATAAFWMVPGLPNKPLATGLILGAMGGLLLGRDAASNDAQASGLAVQGRAS